MTVGLLFPIGATILAITMIVQLSWTIFFCPAEKGPPPDWSLYPIPPSIILMAIGGCWWMWFGH